MIMSTEGDITQRTKNILVISTEPICNKKLHGSCVNMAHTSDPIACQFQNLAKETTKPNEANKPRESDSKPNSPNPMNNTSFNTTRHKRPTIESLDQS